MTRARGAAVTRVRGAAVIRTGRGAAVARTGGRVLGAAALLAGLLLPTAPGAAQLTPRNVEALGVEAWPRGAVTAVTVAVPSGSAQDPEDAEGTGYLLAHALGRMADSALASDPGRVRVTVERSWTLFTVLSRPDRWRASLDALSSVLFRIPVEEWAIEAARAELLRDFAFESGAPVREFEDETYRTLTSALDPWALPIRGFPHSVRRLERGQLRAFHRTRYLRDRAAVAVVGPVDVDAVVRAVPARRVAAPGRILGGREREAGRDGRGASRLTWLAGDRLSLLREITNAWIGIGLPAPRGASRTALELFAQVLEERLNPFPPDPGIYRAEVRVEESPEGPIVVVMAATAPEVAGRWEAEILATIDELSGESPHVSFFERWRERYRSAVALREMAPERRAERFVLDLLRDGRIRDVDAELDEASPGDLHDLARSLGEPRILLLGPDLSEP